MSAVLHLVPEITEEEEGPIEVAVEDLEEVDDYDGWIGREGKLIAFAEHSVLADRRHVIVLTTFTLISFSVFTINFILATF